MPATRACLVPLRTLRRPVLQRRQRRRHFGVLDTGGNRLWASAGCCTIASQSPTSCTEVLGAGFGGYEGPPVQWARDFNDHAVGSSRAHHTNPLTEYVPHTTALPHSVPHVLPRRQSAGRPTAFHATSPSQLLCPASPFCVARWRCARGVARTESKPRGSRGVTSGPMHPGHIPMKIVEEGAVGDAVAAFWGAHMCVVREAGDGLLLLLLLLPPPPPPPPPPPSQLLVVVGVCRRRWRSMRHV